MTTFDPARYHPAQDLLNDRVILITGAGDGIGRAAALACAAHGARLVLLGRTRRKLEAVHDEIAASGAPPPSLALVDLAKAQGPAYVDLVDKIGAAHGRLDGLLHNAALLGDRGPIEHFDIGTWMEVLHVNLTAPFLLTRLLYPLLRRSQDASVVFTTSSVGRRGKAFTGAYAVSKFGIEGLSQVLADETGEGTQIRFNCVNPGRTRTGMRRKAFPGEDAGTLRPPADLMPTYLYLLGPDSAGVTGKSLDCQDFGSGTQPGGGSPAAS
jgi:NAD(P)-dependent dehydrogenase (short-subunit alcohol dehydrogenase family)